jgi:hypothetical protein
MIVESYIETYILRAMIFLSARPLQAEPAE